MGAEVRQVAGFVGRWQIGADEDDALMYLPYGDQVLYIRGLRRWMDYSTGVVGVTRRISYQMLYELLEIQRERGSTQPDSRPSRQQVRSMLSRLEGRGLVVPLARDNQFGGLVFSLPLAAVGQVRSNEEQPRSNQSGTTRAAPVLAGVSSGLATNEQPRRNNRHQGSGNNSTNVECKNSDEFSAEADDGCSGIQRCPHRQLLALWSEVFARHAVAKPNPALWGGSSASRDMRARWMQASRIVHRDTGLPLYEDLAGGLAWWRSFFEYLRDRCGGFLLRADSKFFDLRWVVKRNNFDKAMEGKYED